MSEKPAGDQPSRGRKPRRAARPATSGVDPTPSDHALNSRASEDLPEGWGEATSQNTARKRSAKDSAKNREVKGENDDRLQLDRPPHWG